MRRALGLLFFCALALRAEAPAERRFSLGDSIQTALQNNQALLTVQQDVKIAKNRVSEARALLYPTVGVNMNASRYLADDYAVLPNEFGNVVLRPSKADAADTFYAGRLSLNQTLYNGGRTVNNVRLAEAALAQSRVRADQVRAQVTADAAKAYFDVLLARKVRGLNETTLDDVTALLAGVPARDAAQRVQLQEMRAEVRRRLADSRRDEEKARMNFLSTLGLELYTQAEFDGDLATQPLELDLAKLLARAQEARLELRGTEYQQEIDRLTLNLTEAERFPVVAFGAGYELNDRKFPLQSTFWNTTLNVSLPIFDGFASRARIRQQRLQVGQNRLFRAALEDRISREVRDAYGDLTFWQDELKARKSDWNGLESSAKETGLMRPLDRAQIHLSLLSAAEAYWTAVHGHRVALARLEKTVGSSLSDSR